MVEALALIFVVTVVVSGYAVWRSAWGLPPPPPPHADRLPRGGRHDDDLAFIARAMQNQIHSGTYEHPNLGTQEIMR